jgi:hypothetical protein
MDRITAPITLAAAFLLTACGSSDPIDKQDTCRTTARRVFPAVVQERMTGEQGQAEVDKGCAGVDATARKAIVDAERDKALLDWAGSTKAASPSS